MVTTNKNVLKKTWWLCHQVPYCFGLNTLSQLVISYWLALLNLKIGKLILHVSEHCAPFRTNFFFAHFWCFLVYFQRILSTKLTISQKLENCILFSQISAHWASFIPIWPLLREGDLYVVNWDRPPGCFGSWTIRTQTNRRFVPKQWCKQIARSDNWKASRVWDFF